MTITCNSNANRIVTRNGIFFTVAMMITITSLCDTAPDEAKSRRRARWDAWKGKEGLDDEVARMEYIAKVDSLMK